MTLCDLAGDLRRTLENQGYSANLCRAEMGTQSVTGKMRICGLDFDSLLIRKFFGREVASDAGLLPFRELD